MTPPPGGAKGRRPELVKELVAFFQAGASKDLVVGPDTPLLEWGLLDSVRILELADFLRAKAGFRLDASALSKDNFKDARAIARLVDGAARGA